MIDGVRFEAGDGVLVVIALLLGGALVTVAGYGVSMSLAGHRRSYDSFAYAPVLGYVLLQLLFLFAYRAGFSVAQAAIFSLALGGALTLGAIWRQAQYRQLACEIKTVIPWRTLTCCALGVVIVSAWPYFLSGWEGYWHSGNEDIIDALNGRDAYLSGVLHDLVSARAMGLLNVDTVKQSYLLPMGILPVTTDNFVEGWIRIQYSSVAFWSYLLSAYHGMDAFLIQALLNLLLMALGVYQLGVRLLKLSRASALCAAGASVLSNFYLISYFAGHEGSMMYNAVAPFLLLLTYQWIEEGRWCWRSCLAIGVMLLMLINTYPFPLPYLVLPLSLFAMYRLLLLPHRWPQRIVRLFQAVAPEGGRAWNLPRLFLLGGMLLLVLGVGFWQTWELFSPIRFKAENQFRAWGTILSYVGWLQYWGIWPSSLPSGNSYLLALIQNDLLVWASLLFAGAMTGLTLYGFYRMSRDGLVFFAIWILIWLLMLPAMRFVVADSYYLYKFLYINAFVGFLALAYAWESIARSGNQRLRQLVWWMLVVWAAVNLLHDGIGGWSIASRAYNKDYPAYQEVLSVPTEVLAQTFIDIPREDHRDVLRQTLTTRGIKLESDKRRAKYLLRMNGLADVVVEQEAPPVWSSALFRIVPAPQRNMVFVVGPWEPELLTRPEGNPARYPFRWVSDRKMSRVEVHVVNRDTRTPYLHFCAESGPSVDYASVPLTLTDARGRLLASYGVDGYACHWLDVSSVTAFPITIATEAIGRRVSPIEVRKLVYRLSNVGLAAAPYAPAQLMAALTHATDIIPGVAPNASRWLERIAHPVLLGNGWYDYETYQGERFRWVGRGAEVVVAPGAAALMVEVERGAGLGAVKTELQLSDAAGSVLVSTPLPVGRGVVRLPLPAMHGVTTYRLQIPVAASPTPGDRRLLNFRVFKISAE